MEGREIYARIAPIVRICNIFDIDKEKDFELYRQEERRFIGAIFLAITKNPQYGDHPEYYGVEIMQCVKDCIKYYNSTKGDFCNYLAWSLHQKLRHCIGQDEHKSRMSGITGTLTNKQLKLIKKYLHYADSRGINPNNEEVLREYADMIGLETEILLEYICIYENARAIDGIITNDDGENTNILDNIPDTSDSMRMYEEQGRIEELLMSIDEAFLMMQNRQPARRIVSMWLTSRIIEDIDVNTYSNVMERVSFLDKATFCYCITRKKLLTLGQIAKANNVNTIASISRTINGFKDKLLTVLDNKKQ